MPAILLVVSLLPSAHAQDSLGVWRTIGSDLRAAADDGLSLLVAPASFTARSWLTAGGIIVATGGSMAVDSGGRAMAHRNQSSTGDALANAFRQGGEVTVGVGLGAATYLTGLITQSAGVRVTGRLMLESMLYSGIVTLTVKSLLGRARPYTGEGPFAFHGLEFGTERTSMPSGHATVAFALASTVAARVDNLPVDIACYAIAAGTGISRIYDDKHWVSDVVLGAAIGTVIGNAVVHLHTADGGNGAWQVLPTGSGVTVVGRL